MGIRAVDLFANSFLCLLISKLVDTITVLFAADFDFDLVGIKLIELYYRIKF